MLCFQEIATLYGHLHLILITLNQISETRPSLFAIYFRNLHSLDRAKDAYSMDKNSRQILTDLFPKFLESSFRCCKGPSLERTAHRRSTNKFVSNSNFVD